MGSDKHDSQMISVGQKWPCQITNPETDVIEIQQTLNILRSRSKLTVMNQQWILLSEIPIDSHKHGMR